MPALPSLKGGDLWLFENAEACVIFGRSPQEGTRIRVLYFPKSPSTDGLFSAISECMVVGPCSAPLYKNSNLCCCEFVGNNGGAVTLTRRLKDEGMTARKVWGIIGCIRFTMGFHLVFICDKKRAASLGGRTIYSITSVQSLPLFIQEKTADESRYLSLFNSVFDMLPGCFFFAKGHDLTRPVAAQLPGSDFDAEDRTRSRLLIDRFVFNAYLLMPMVEVEPSINTTIWCTSVVNGATQQRTFISRQCSDTAGRQFSITVLCRRSRHCVGPRYYRRGVDPNGRVANECECEQILWELPVWRREDDMSIREFKRALGSTVMIRGSIPLHWCHSDSVSPKPEIILVPECDPNFDHTEKHFTSLLQTYGSPVVILNMIRQQPSTHTEVPLGLEFERCVQTVAKRLKEAKAVEGGAETEPPALERRLSLLDASSKDNDLVYLAYDWLSKQKEVGFDGSLRTLFDWGAKMQELTGFDLLTIGEEGLVEETFSRQCGIVRVNCIDCLDRTNLGMFSIGLHAFLGQLERLKVHMSSDAVIVPTPCQLQTASERSNDDWRVLGFDTRAQELNSDGDPEFHRVGVDWGRGGPPSMAIERENPAVEESVPDPRTMPGELLQLVSDLWGDVGDLIAIGYAGSEALHRAAFTIQEDSDEWIASKRSNTRIAIKRYLQNAFSDGQKQRALDLFVGSFRPFESTSHSWDIRAFPDEETLRIQSAVEGSSTKETRGGGGPTTPHPCFMFSCLLDAGWSLAACLMSECMLIPKGRNAEEFEIPITAHAELPMGRASSQEEWLGARYGSIIGGGGGEEESPEDSLMKGRSVS